MNKAAIIILALVSVFSAQGEAFAKKKVVEPVAVDSLTLLIQAGDSLMQQYNTFEAMRYYQQAFAMKDTQESRTKLADCYYQRGNYRQTADLLKLVPEDSLSHEAFRQLALSYQKQNETDADIYWSGQLLVANSSYSFRIDHHSPKTFLLIIHLVSVFFQRSIGTSFISNSFPKMSICTSVELRVLYVYQILYVHCSEFSFLWVPNNRHVPTIFFL